MYDKLSENQRAWIIFNQIEELLRDEMQNLGGSLEFRKQKVRASAERIKGFTCAYIDKYADMMVQLLDSKEFGRLSVHEEYIKPKRQSMIHRQHLRVLLFVCQRVAQTRNNADGH